MPSEEEITTQLTLLATYRRMLAHYLNQQAIFGKAFMPVYVEQGIREACTHIHRIKGILRSWQELVEDHPDDDSADNQQIELYQAKKPEQLLREAGETFRQGQQAGAIGILEAIERMIAGELKGQIGLLRNLFVTLMAPTLPNIDEVVRNALQLWERYDEDAHEIVVRALEWVQGQPGGLEFLREHFSVRGSEGRRLLRDSRLRGIIPQLHLVQSQYQWPFHQTSVVNHPDVARWLEANGLAYNPFGSGAIEFDPPLLGSRAHPDQWLSIMERKSTLIRGNTYQDCAAVALFLHYTLQSSEPQNIFPVALVLPLVNNQRQPRASNMLQVIVQTVGEAWIGFLAHNPAALLDLQPSIQAELAAFCRWVAGSYQSLFVLLDQAGLSHDSKGLMLLRRLEAPDGIEPQIPPPKSQLIRWLRIRPTELQYTYLIVTCRSDQIEAQCRKQASGLLKLAMELERIDVIVKLFMPWSTGALPMHINAISLTWEPQRLKQMLRDRFVLASNNNYRAFKDLFGPMLTDDPDQILVRKAAGSLSRMLELGNQVINTHIGRDLADLEYKYLDQADLDIL